MEDLQEFETLASSAGVEAMQVITGSRKAPHPKYFVGEGKATATGNHLHCFDTGGRGQSFKLLEIFHIFVLRKIDVYQYRLLTGVITVKQA